MLRVFKITGKPIVKCPHYKGTLQRKISRRLFEDAYVILFSDFLHKSICCGYSSELPRLVEAVQMSTHNKCFYKEVEFNKVHLL